MSAAGETEGRIAIIGMSGRFPGAPDIAAFWRNLRNGVESVTFFTDDQLEDGAEPATRASASYIKARPVLTRPVLIRPVVIRPVVIRPVVASRVVASRVVASRALGRTAAAWGGCWPGWRPGRSAWRCPASG